MTLFSGHTVSFRGSGICVPERVMTNKDLEKIVDTSDEWIRERSGIRERRIAMPGEQTSHFALGAARKALEEAGIAPEDLDMVIVATNSPDTLFPSVAARVQAGLGAERAGAMDLQAGCTGCIYAITTAASGIAAGIWRHVVVIGSEVLSRMIDWEDRNTCVLFGDGAGAFVLSRGEAGEGSSFCSASLRAEGDKEDLITFPGGLSECPASPKSLEEKKHQVYMKGNDVFKFVNRKLPPFLRDFCDQSGISPEDVDLWIFHQANLRIIDGVLERFGLPRKKTFVNLDKYGNTSAASVFIAFHEARETGRLLPGQKVVLCSFGAGMTYGAVFFTA